MRIDKHPILDFSSVRKKPVTFTFEGRKMQGYEGEAIAAALHANGIQVYRTSYSGRPRGFFCAIGKCSSCFMVVNGLPNIRTCITPLKEGMVIEKQEGKGKLNV